MRTVARLLNWIRCWWPVVAFTEWVLEQRLALANESLQTMCAEHLEALKKIKAKLTLAKTEINVVRSQVTRDLRDMTKSRDLYRQRNKRFGEELDRRRAIIERLGGRVVQ